MRHLRRTIDKKNEEGTNYVLYTHTHTLLVRFFFTHDDDDEIESRALGQYCKTKISFKVVYEHSTGTFVLRLHLVFLFCCASARHAFTIYLYHSLSFAFDFFSPSRPPFPFASLFDFFPLLLFLFFFYTAIKPQTETSVETRREKEPENLSRRHHRNL